MRLTLAVLAALLITKSHAASAPDSCLGKFCLLDKQWTESEVVNRFGPGKESLQGKDGLSVSHCYFLPREKLWLELTFDRRQPFQGKVDLKDIFLTSETLCEQHFQAKEPLDHLMTTSGITVGADEDDVLQLKSTPTRVDDSVARQERNPAYGDTKYAVRYGEKVLVYRKPSDLGFNFFYISNGKVKSIWLSMSE